MKCEINLFIIIFSIDLASLERNLIIYQKNRIVEKENVVDNVKKLDQWMDEISRKFNINSWGENKSVSFRKRYLSVWI